MVTNTLTEKHLAWIIDNAGLALATSDRERLEKLIQMTWQQAQTKPRRRQIEDIVTDYAAGAEELLNRLRYTHDVMRNTIRKMTHGIPTELYWVGGHDSIITILGIHHPAVTGWNGSTVDATAKIADGSVTVSADAQVEFEVRPRYSNKPGARVKLPLTMLHNDPIAIAQYVRRLCKAYVAEQEQSVLENLQAQQTELTTQLEQQHAKILAHETRMRQWARKQQPRVRTPKPVGV